MKKIFLAGFVFFLLFALSAAGIHKFYVSIYQVNYASDKKMLQITSRIFIDDINNALEKKYNRKFHLGEKEETPEEAQLLLKYMSEHFFIKVNGKQKPLEFRSKEMESTVLICYFRITGIPKITSLEIHNKILFDYVTEQQNIIQTTINGKKNSVLLTVDNPEQSIDL